MMDIQPIKTEQDYERALAQIEKLWGSEQGTSNGDRLETLIGLVEAYESIHYPIAPTA